MVLIYEISQKKKGNIKSILTASFMVHNSVIRRILISQDAWCVHRWGLHCPRPPSTTMTSNRDKHCLIEDGWMEATRSNLELTLDARSFCLRVHVGMSAQTHCGTCYFVCTMSRSAQWALSLCFDTTWFMQGIDLHRLHLSKVEWFLIFLFLTLSCAKVQPILGTLTFPCTPLRSLIRD